MTKSHIRAAEARATASVARSFKKGLMFAASAGIIAVAMPSAGVYGTRAFAQTLPDECEDTNPDDPTNPNAGNRQVNAGETITCLQPDDTTPLPKVKLTGPPDDIRDLTLVFGDGSNPMKQSSTEYGVGLDAGPDGDLNLTISENTFIYGVAGPNVVAGAIAAGANGGSLTINNNGEIRIVGPTEEDLGRGFGILATVDGDSADGNPNDLTINSSLAPIYGSVIATNTGDGVTDLNLDRLFSRDPDRGIQISAGAESTGVELSASTVYSKPGPAIYIENESASQTVVSVTESIDSGGDGINLRTQGGEVNIVDTPIIRAVGDAINVDTRIKTIPDPEPPADGSETEPETPDPVYSGGANISIQNTSMPEFDDPNDDTDDLTRAANGILVNSGTGIINIGAEDPQAGTGIKDIYTEGYGILARTSNGTIDIYVEGNINSVNADAINAASNGADGAINITTRGNIVSEKDEGIQAIRNARGDITIKTYGTINSGDEGILARANDSGNVTVSVYKDITAKNDGIRAQALLEDLENPPEGATSDIQVTVNANVNSEDKAIQIDHEGDGSVSLKLSGSSIITAGTDDGIDIDARDGTAPVLVQGGAETIIVAEDILGMISTLSGSSSPAPRSWSQIRPQMAAAGPCRARPSMTCSGRAKAIAPAL